MPLRVAYAPIRPEFNPFLFALVGEEVDGVPLSVLSALSRLGLDPRDEAARLSHLADEGSGSRSISEHDRPVVGPALELIAGTRDRGPAH
jgi:hypothetical protein